MYCNIPHPSHETILLKGFSREIFGAQQFCVTVPLNLEDERGGEVMGEKEKKMGSLSSEDMWTLLEDEIRFIHKSAVYFWEIFYLKKRLSPLLLFSRSCFHKSLKITSNKCRYKYTRTSLCNYNHATTNNSILFTAGMSTSLCASSLRLSRCKKIIINLIIMNNM